MATILIADDSPVNRRLLVALLSSRGYHVQEACDGSQALAMAKAAPPDLIIADVLMPVMDGYEMLQRLQADPRSSRIPVVFFTAHYGARTLVLAGGAAWFLTNADSAELNNVVQRVLAGEVESRASSPVQPTMGRVKARDDQADSPVHSAARGGMPC